MAKRRRRSEMLTLTPNATKGTLNDVEAGVYFRSALAGIEGKEACMFVCMYVCVTVVNSFIHLELFASPNALGIPVVENLCQVFG